VNAQSIFSASDFIHTGADIVRCKARIRQGDVAIISIVSSQRCHVCLAACAPSERNSRHSILTSCPVMTSGYRDRLRSPSSFFEIRPTGTHIGLSNESVMCG